MNDDDRKSIERYPANVRTNHWIVAIAFVLAALSGLALFHPAFFWLANLFGGGTWTRILHPFIAVVMVLAFLLLAGKVWADNRMQQRDWAWLRGWRDVVDNHEERVPEAGKYNGGQKLLFFLIVLCLLVLVLTGIVLWRDYFSAMFPVGLLRLAAVLHAASALVLICGIIVHIYAAIWVRGSVQAMTRGTVTPAWAWKHHRAWFRDVIGRNPPR